MVEECDFDRQFLFDEYVAISHRYGLKKGRDGFSYFRSGEWINIWGVLLLALAGAWWQRPERPRKKFNKICFLGLHGEI